MLRVIPNGPNRLDLEFDGKLDGDAMKVALDELVAKSEGIEHGTMLYRIEDFDMPTLGALWIELSRLPALFRVIRKFDRAAVLAGKTWIRKVGEIEGALIPGLEIKSFNLDEEELAEAWLAE